MKIVLFIANSISIMMALLTPKLMKSYYIVHYQFIIYIFLYIYLFWLSNWEFMDYLLNNTILIYMQNIMQKINS